MDQTPDNGTKPGQSPRTRHRFKMLSDGFYVLYMWEMVRAFLFLFHNYEILKAIETLNQNLTHYCRSTTTLLARLIAQSRFNPAPASRAAAFSDKEREIIKLICEEKNTREIADLLYMSSWTVEGYSVKILEKMEVKSVAGIVTYALYHQLYKLETLATIKYYQLCLRCQLS